MRLVVIPIGDSLGNHSKSDLFWWEILRPQLAVAALLPADMEFDAWQWGQSVLFRSLGQVFLLDNPISGGLVLAAMVVCSPVTALLALLGSLTGNATALLVGAPLPDVYNGLWGYNAVLCPPLRCKILCA